MLKVPFLIAITLTIAFLGGIWSSQRALNATQGFGGLDVNGWVAYPNIQSKDADPYAKAHRANDGKLLLGRAEGLIFHADTDNEGRELLANCDYSVSGNVPPALFWTLRTSYPEGSISKVSAQWPTIINGHKILRNTDGDFDIAISTTAQPRNWLAIAGTDEFSLQLTLIDTPSSNDSGIRELSMPSIIRESCR